jgi:serine/threonine protein phosphatase 1
MCDKMVTAVLAPATLPPGRRVYAVGDVHGCLAKLRELHAVIAKDLAARPIEDALLIHLGDYVDRGPDSAGVIDLLARGPSIAGMRVINLMGNHENMMLAALAGHPQDAPLQWRRNGGVASLESWGIPARNNPAAWRSLIPTRHLAFIGELQLSHREGGYLFVHAGVNPKRALGEQIAEDLMWIREPFLSWTGDLGAVVVHGHTPAGEPTIRPNRIGIDTGAVLGGRLTSVVLEADTLRFMQV